MTQPPLTLDEIRAKRTVSISEAAAVLGVSRSSAYEYARKGDLPSIRLGKVRRVPATALLRLIDPVDLP